MRAVDIVRRLISSCRAEMHAARFRAVLAAIDAILTAQRLSLTAIGRSYRGKTRPRHGIKRIDRLLGNVKLAKELPLLYAALARAVIGHERRIIIAVDWTQLVGGMWSIDAAVAFSGRAVRVLSQVYPKEDVGSRALQTEFLRTLRRIVPEGCTPVLVADGGFRSPFFRACREIGFHYVIRLRNEAATAHVPNLFRRCFTQIKRSFHELFALAGRNAKCLGVGSPYTTSQLSEFARLVVGPKPKVGSTPANKRRALKRADSATEVEAYERRRAREPWLLATSLIDLGPDEIVAIYATRMQIEETFRDTKDPRYGWALDHAASRSPLRLNNLLALASLAFFAVLLIGARAEECGVERSLRASSSRIRVLSLFTCGALVLRARALSQLGGIRAIWRQLEHLHSIQAAFFETASVFEARRSTRTAYFRQNPRPA